MDIRKSKLLTFYHKHATEFKWESCAGTWVMGLGGNPSHVIIIMASLILQNLASCLNLQVKLHVSYENKHRKR